jgi:nitric-oxide synthase
MSGRDSEVPVETHETRGHETGGHGWWRRLGRQRQSGSVHPNGSVRPNRSVDVLDAQTITILQRYHQDTRLDRRRLVSRLADVAAAGGGPGWAPSGEELSWAVRTAWRDEARCIGRSRWASAVVRDRRDLTDPEAIAEDLVEHLREATNGGRIRSVVTVLNPSVSVLNDQLVGYAGYEQGEGAVLGDPRHVDLTKHALAAGWPGERPGDTEPRARTRWDVLPLLVRGAHGDTAVYELPADAVREVPLHHPDHPWFAGLDLRWYGVPALLSHRLVVTDSVSYPVAISGWYLSSEIACRDLADADRYDALPEIAARMDLDTSSRRSLWEGVAENVLHQAVLASFDAAGVRIADPPAESDLYLRFVAAEQRRGRSVRAEWPWIVPPWHAARLSVYHAYQDSPDPALLPAYRPDAGRHCGYR